MGVLAYTKVELRGELTEVAFHLLCLDGTQVMGFGGKCLYLLSHLVAHTTISFKT